MNNIFKNFLSYPVLVLETSNLDVLINNSFIPYTLITISLILTFIKYQNEYNPFGVFIVNKTINTFSSMMNRRLRSFLSLITTIFTLVLFLNLIGLTPSIFAVTGNLIITTSLGIIVYSTIVMTGIMNIRIKLFFLSFFNVPGIALIIIYPIEFLSSIIKPFSIGIRLAANISAGHIVKHVLLDLMHKFSYIFFIPYALIVVINVFEIINCIMQAYIISILTCTYLSEVIQ